MGSNEFDRLKLKNQLCFPLYSAAREVVKKYRPYLDPIGLTYTQYITMMVLWEERDITVKALGERLFLDSGTLTPVLKSLETKGYVVRKRNSVDERSVLVTLTNAGECLKEKAKDVPLQIAQCVGLDADEAATLYALLYKVLGVNE